MVYELRCYTLVPGKMPEYLKAAETIGRPARGNNYGVNHGYWTSEFGALNQIWHLWKYDSYDERTRLRAELQKNKDWTEKYVSIVKTCLVRQDLRLMNPVVDIKPSGSTETVGVFPTVGSTDQVVITRATANIASPMPNRVRM